MINRMPPELFVQPPIRSSFSSRQRFPLRLRRIVILALLAIVLMGLAAYWAFGGNDQAPAEIPTIKAEGPLKERPEQPGGIDIPHQNELVFQKIDSSTANKQPAVEHLLPQPAAPQPVESSQAPSGPSATAIPSTESSASALTSSTQAPTPETAPVQTVTKTSSAAQSAPQEPRKTEVLTSPSTPIISHEEKASTTLSEQPAAKPQEIKSAPSSVVKDKVAVETKPIPPTTKTFSKPPVTESLPKEMFTDGIVSKGTSLVQLGSFPERQAAQAEMQKMQSKYASMLGDIKLHLTQAEIPGKGTYYRVQGGPVPETQARSVCAKVTGQKAACIVVKSK